MPSYQQALREESLHLNLSYDKYKKLIIVIFLISIVSFPLISMHQPVEAAQVSNGHSDKHKRIIEGEYILKFKEGTGRDYKLKAIENYGGKMRGELKKGAIKADVSEMNRENFLQKARMDKKIEWVEPNFIIEVEMIPNDSYWSSQWGPNKIGAEEAWDLELGNQDVLVVVVDTGIYYYHPDLAANYIAGGYDWVNNDDDPLDDHGHGTHCAGIIAAIMNNEVGIAGLAQVKIIAEKFLDSDGRGSSWDAAQAIEHSVDIGKTISDKIILSNSWGSTISSITLEDAMEYAYENGVLIVAAAGNSGSNRPLHPSTLPEVICVSATDSNDAIANFSNYGDAVELAAPGVSIYSTYLNSSYCYMSGTSMACPHVAGVAAMVWSQFPNYNRDQLRMVLQISSEDLGASGKDQYYGYGRIDAYQAVQGSQPHDLRVAEVVTPNQILENSTVKINSTIQNIGSNIESGVTVQFLVNNTLQDTKLLSEIQICESANQVFDWGPPNAGSYNITIYVLPVEGEDSIMNNWASKIVEAQEIERILIVSDNDGEYSRSITSADDFASALSNHGYEFNIWNESIQGMPSLDVLSNFRLVIWTCSGFWDWAVDPADALTLTQFLNNGGSILLEGDDIAFDHRSDNFMSQVAHAEYRADSNRADGLTVTYPSHPICESLPSTFEWEIEPGWEDGTAPINGGEEILRYIDTQYSAAITSGEGGSGSTVYICFPIGCLGTEIREEIVISSVKWLLGSNIIRIEGSNPETAGLKVYVDKIAYQLPAEIILPEDSYEFVTLPSWENNNTEYHFDCWEDESGQVISSEIFFDHYVKDDVTLFACYSEAIPSNISISTSEIRNVVVGEEFVLNAIICNNGPEPLNDVLVKLRYPSNIEIQVTEDDCVSLESISSSESHTLTWHITANEEGILRLIVTANGRGENNFPIIDIERLNAEVVE
jgi:thermitase